MSGDEAAVFKALADDAAKAIGHAGGTLADFTEKTARTADEASDRVLFVEARNADAFEKIRSSRTPAKLPGGGVGDGVDGGGDGVPRREIAALLGESTAADPKNGIAEAWKGENGLHLTPAENAAAEQFLRRARDAESRITPVVLEIRDGVPGAGIVGYPEHVLKGAESLKRKLATTLQESPVRELDSAIADVKDSVRYTMTFAEDGYTDGVDRAVARFQEAGFECVKFKNTWGSPAYQGINSFWRDPRTGHVFEMQFHTGESFTAKTDTHAVYEQARLPGVSAEQVRALNDRQNEIFGSVPRPPGATGIKPPRTSK